MAEHCISMSGKEFLEKIMNGERDFSGIHLPLSTNLTLEETYQEVNTLLEKMPRKELNRNPLILKGVDFEGIIAQKFFLVHANLSHARLVEADLKHANLARANLLEANLHLSDLSYTNLSRVDFYLADLSHAKLSYANINKANFTHSDLYKSDFRKTLNLDKAHNLEFAVFNKTLVTLKEREIIEETMKKRIYFNELES